MAAQWHRAMTSRESSGGSTSFPISGTTRKACGAAGRVSGRAGVILD
jgi:hypothetical protein